MKTSIGIILLVLTGLNPANAATVLPLLSKITRPGLMAPPRVSEECRIYSDKILTITTVGDVAVSKILPVTVTSNIDALLNQAALGKIINGSGQIDSSTTYYYAYVADASGTQNPVELKITGSSESHNDAPAALTLEKLLDLNCPSLP